jgi:hypothetical protein
VEAKELALGVIVMGGVRRVFGFAEARLHSCTSRGLNELKTIVQVSSTPVPVTQNDRDTHIHTRRRYYETGNNCPPDVPDKTEKHVETILGCP